jgi:hypothetical protein
MFRAAALDKSESEGRWMVPCQGIWETKNPRRITPTLTLIPRQRMPWDLDFSWSIRVVGGHGNMGRA